ncbi:hypothetical protein SRB5_04800 [Streptomyces sp. RB5]|uniref:Serpin domain-containing protein n=1 Tax=Streptomyces smaragdinus TaxID=2585196 RepID=A0A7K0CB56_9ACTN|nr:serpin family protein [Streptomyces smaragdinus]MQY10372.1 hypothetical protein [Streptomyces smaragdinus]
MVSRRMVLAAGLALLAAGCGDDGKDGPPGDAGRIDAGLVSALKPGDAQAVARSVNAFGFDLLRETAGARPNTVISPLSVATLLAMVLAGAGGDTAKAMARTLHLKDSRDVRVGALLQELADTKDVTLDVSDALWSAPELRMHADYRDFVTGKLGATAKEADLAGADAAREIDGWVKERTHGRIDSIAEDLGLPSEDAVLVLLNAVYFLGTWTTQFDPDRTEDRPFAVPGGTPADVPMMSLSEKRFGHAQRDGYAVLRLPYGKSKRYGMEVFLPDQGADGLEAFLGRLDAAEWRVAVGALEEQEVFRTALPRFELSWSLGLGDALTKLGMGEAFGGGADFSRMVDGGAALNAVVHKTYIRVDEKGTEAAAVTGGAMTTALPADPLVFEVDRPFAFTVSDRETGTVLFLGAVNDPRG